MAAVVNCERVTPASETTDHRITMTQSSPQACRSLPTGYRRGTGKTEREGERREDRAGGRLLLVFSLPNSSFPRFPGNSALLLRQMSGQHWSQTSLSLPERKIPHISLPPFFSPQLCTFMSLLTYPSPQHTQGWLRGKTEEGGKTQFRHSPDDSIPHRGLSKPWILGTEGERDPVWRWKVKTWEREPTRPYGSRAVWTGLH